MRLFLPYFKINGVKLHLLFNFKFLWLTITYFNLVDSALRAESEAETRRYSKSHHHAQVSIKPTPSAVRHHQNPPDDGKNIESDNNYVHMEFEVSPDATITEN